MFFSVSAGVATEYANDVVIFDELVLFFSRCMAKHVSLL